MRFSSVKKLNKEQLRAVRHKKGPLLIIAGAGTGKTTVITERIKYLIEKDLAKPSEILALTFTEKAAREMEERVDRALPMGYTQMWISTFHSFCDRILRREALHVGLDPKYKLNTQSESIQFVRKHLFKFDLDYFRPRGNPTKFVGGMLQHFSRLQDEDISPNEYLAWTKKQKGRISRKGHPELDSGSKLGKIPKRVRNDDVHIEIDKWKELANAYKTYDQLKTKKGVMDFGDVIINTLKLFRKRPNILNQYQNQFKYILVDEFQDTNIAQNELVKTLAGKTENITVVLDDDQSVYRFRGAAVSNALYFRENFPKAKLVTLIKNYRSSQEILDKAYDLIQFNNPDRLEIIENISKELVSMVDKSKELVSMIDEDKRLEVQRGDPPSRKASEDFVHFIHSDRVENEADSVAKEIARLTANSRQTTEKKAVDRRREAVGYKDVAILVRANNHSEPFMRALSRHGIPFQFLGPGRLYRQSETVDLISYLKVLYNFEDNVSMHRLLGIDYFDISARDLIRISNYAKRLQLIKLIRKHFKLVKKESAGQLLYYFLENTGLLQKLLSPDSEEAEKKAKNISKLFDKLKTYEADHEDASVRAVVDWIDLASELGESPLAADTDWMDVNAVNILTVHSSKGLEFPVIFLVNLVAQRFPTIERREQIPIPDELIKEVLPKGDYHAQEERRLFYVGMTRAKSKVYLTAANYYGEGKREKRLSPFIFETLGDIAVSAELNTEDSKQMSFLDYEPTEKDIQHTTNNIEKIHVDFLSYSQIQTFKICPLHYKLRYIYRLPTPPTSAQSFGNSFHITMKEFYDVVKSGKRPTEKLIHGILEDSWINQGYLSKSHETRSLEKAKSFLSRYLKESFDKNSIPEVMEQPFIIRIQTKKGSVKVGGKIDRVDANGGEIHVIDYKTGANALTQKQADEDLQLSIYGLAATMIPEAPFKKSPEKVKLSLMYFDPPHLVTTQRTHTQLEEAKKMIMDYKKQIEQSDFKCLGNYLCQKDNCEYKLFCQVDE
jgi:DNA helicase-2/ATP-dependent DNA helicase PcrA